jgi:hypothetical protein
MLSDNGNTPDEITSRGTFICFLGWLLFFFKTSSRHFSVTNHGLESGFTVCCDAKLPDCREP